MAVEQLAQEVGAAVRPREHHEVPPVVPVVRAAQVRACKRRDDRWRSVSEACWSAGRRVVLGRLARWCLAMRGWDKAVLRASGAQRALRGRLALVSQRLGVVRKQHRQGEQRQHRRGARGWERRWSRRSEGEGRPRRARAGHSTCSGALENARDRQRVADWLLKPAVAVSTRHHVCSWERC